MKPTASPQAWQQALGQHLSRALSTARLAHAPQADASGPVATHWQLPPRDLAQCGAEPALAELIGVAATRPLLVQCLSHYRHQLAGNAAEDDLGLALAAYLGACRQAFDQEPCTPQRWQAVVQWLRAWVLDELPWDDAPLAQRQEAFERFAVLAVALGEWTVQASRQGQATLASATWMARNSLRGQLGVDLPTLCAVLRSLDTATAANPSAAAADLGAAAASRPVAKPV
jgi:hypothetical protein